MSQKYLMSGSTLQYHSYLSRRGWLKKKLSKVRLNSTRKSRGNVPRVEATHLVVALQPTVHDGRISLLRNALLRDLLVYPVGEIPHLGSDLAKLDLPGRIFLDRLLEVVVELGVVEEDVRVMEPAVEVALDRPDGLEYASEI
jgi:hypothetical protein